MSVGGIGYDRTPCFDDELTLVSDESAEDSKLLEKPEHHKLVRFDAVVLTRYIGEQFTRYLLLCWLSV